MLRSPMKFITQFPRRLPRMLSIFHISLLGSFMFFIPLVSSEALATLLAEELVTTNDPEPAGPQIAESHLDLEAIDNWESRFSGDSLFNPRLKENSFHIQNHPRVRLKRPGRLPGIEFGVELHSLQAFQSVVPSEGLAKGLDLKEEQPLLLPPSINAPDYNGGFLRFTW